MEGNSSINEQLIPNDDDQIVQIQISNESKSFCSCLKSFRYPIISTLITLILVVIPILIYKKDIYKKHIEAPCLEVVNKYVIFIFWVIHCASLIVLPIMMKCLFEDKLFEICYFFPPIMMLINDLVYCMPMKCYWIPSLIEYLISMLLFFLLPFKTIYIWKLNKFWIGELTLMLLTFVSISASLEASTLSYILFGRYIRIEKMLFHFPKNPKDAISFINMFIHSNYYVMTGAFLSCYSLFTLFSIGHGFLITAKHSKLMLIPFILLTSSTFFSNKIIASILLSQIFIHFIYLTLLQFQLTRTFLAEFGKLCDANFVFRKTGKKSITTLLISDIITFSLFVFPTFGMVLDGNRYKFPWGFFVGGVIVMTVGMSIQIFIFMVEEGSLFLILSGLCIAGSVYLFGYGFRGYVPFIKAYTFEVTSLSWSIMLDLIAYNCGHSPVLYRIYRGLIIVASLTMVELFEYIGWMEILFGVVQFIVDEFVNSIILKTCPPYFGWTMFASIGVATFCPIPGVVALLLFFCFCECCC